MAFPSPSYVYTSTESTRTFHHRWQSNGQVYECDLCRSSCDVGTCYSKHWTVENIHEKLVLNVEQERQLDIISASNISVFMLCCGPRNATLYAQEFLLDAGINVVPRLLALLFTRARQLRLKVSFYVKLQRQEMIFSSSDLDILHHYDIGESVDVLFCMLLTRVHRFVSMREISYGTEYAVKRIRLEIQRIGSVGDGRLSVPLQYRVKQACAELPHQPRDILDKWRQLPLAVSDGKTSTASSQLRRSDESFGVHEDLSNIEAGSRAAIKTFGELRVIRAGDEYSKMLCTNLLTEAVANIANVGIEGITAAYLKHVKSNSYTPLKLQVNLYALKICRNSRELFVVPHHFVCTTQPYAQTPSYIILADVLGNFSQLVAITDVMQFLRRDRGKRIVSCPKCSMEFKQQTRLALHKLLHCGRDFEILTMAPDCVEIYERCIPLNISGGSEKWLMYGIIE